MPDTAVIDVIVQGLSDGMLHPDGEPRVMPHFRANVMPDEMADEVRKQTRGMAEAFAHHIETHGYTFITDRELQQLRDQAAKAQGITAPTVSAWCNQPGCACTEPLLQVNVTGERISINGPALIAAFHSRQPACPHGPTA